MRFAEIFLRLGCALVAWMMLYAHFLWLAVLGSVGCGPDGDELHRLLLGLVPLTCGFAFLLQVTRFYADIHRMLRWLGVPLVALLPFVLKSIWVVFSDVNIRSSVICADGVPAFWQQVWAPAQLTTTVLAAYLILRIWRSSRLDSSEPERKSD